MLEKIVFNLVAITIFIIVFSKIIRKNDTNYIIILILQSIGILINFIEIKIEINANLFFKILRYILSIIMPCIVIYLERKGFNFTELISCIMAKFFIILGDNKKAKNILIKLVTKYPDSYSGHKLLAQIYEKEGGMRKAIDEYVKLVDIKGNDYNSYFKIADLLKELGQKDEAIEMLENLVRSKPDSYEGSMLLGELLCEKSCFKEAERVYQEALKYKPFDFDLYYNLGIVYTMMSDFQMAKDMYEKAAKINHKAYNANYYLGQISLIQGDIDIAEIYFKQSLYENLEAKSYFQLAKIYVLKGEKDMAIIFLNKAIEIDPDLLKLANNEKIFESIKQHISVSVKMENDVIEENEEKEEKKEFKLELERRAREYLESTNLLVRDMNENAIKDKIDKKVDQIIEKKQELEKEEEQRELGSN